MATVTSSYNSGTTFTVGENVSSIEFFELKLEAYKNQAFMGFWRRD